MNTKISVIIPFYNTPHIYLRKAIDKLINQSFQDFELLLINDGSSQDYSDLIYEYQKVDNRIKFINQQNLGVSAARNTGIRNAEGEYIVFHDADDFVENNYLYSLYNEIGKSDLVICGIAAQWYPSTDSYVDIRQFLSTPSAYNWVQYTNFTPNKIFKKNIITDNQILFNENIKLGEDALFIAQYLTYCKLIRTIPQRLYYYIPHPTSATKTLDHKYWEYEQQVISHLFNTYPLNEDEQHFMQYWLYQKLFGVINYYLYGKLDENIKIKVINEVLEHKWFSLIEKANINTSQQNPYYSDNMKFEIFLMKTFNNRINFIKYLMTDRIFGRKLKSIGKRIYRIINIIN